MSPADLAPLLLLDEGHHHGHVNFLAIPVSAIAAFVLGGLWYSPLLFAKPWKRLLGIPADAKGNPTKPMIICILMLGVAAVGLFVLAQQVEPEDWIEGALLGLSIGGCFVAPAMATNYAFTGKGFLLWLIDASYQVLSLVLIGLILGVWHT